jgi:hypothetical protein
MANAIAESGMDFITTNTYHIEQSPLYQDIKAFGIGSVEFVREKDGELLFVEAKTSFPNPDSMRPGNDEIFRKAICAICHKFEHSLNLYSYVMSGIAYDELPSDFAPTKGIPLVFVLIICGHEKDWCIPVQKALTNAFPQYLKKLCNPEMRVMNSQTATELQLTVQMRNE